MKGKLSIGKVTCCGSPEEDYISIEVEDTLSSIQFVRVKVDLITFTKALFGLGNVPIEFELNGIERVGKKYEYKTEEVYIPSSPFTALAIRDAIHRYEVDGWSGSDRDAKNHHNWVKNDKDGSIYNVHFSRWVDVVKEEEN